MTDEAQATVDGQWYFEEAGQRRGPFEEQTLIAHIKAGKLSYGSLVWKKGYSDWVRLEHSELRTHVEEVAPPPLTGAHINNTIVWVLTFAPVLCYLLEHVVAGLFETNQAKAMHAASNCKYWFITYGLNVGLSYFDEHRPKPLGTIPPRSKAGRGLCPSTCSSGRNA
jgi:hypothetical protein